MDLAGHDYLAARIKMAGVLLLEPRLSLGWWSGALLRSERVREWTANGLNVS